MSRVRGGASSRTTGGRPRRRPSYPPPIPPGLPLVWHASLAIARANQACRSLLWPTRPNHPGHWQAPELQAIRALCGIERHPRIRRPAFGPTYVVRCPTCTRWTMRLIAELARPRWRCGGCVDRRQPKLANQLARYAHGVRLGLRGVIMIEIWRDLREAMTKLLRKGRTPQDLHHLSVGATLLAPRPGQAPYLNQYGMKVTAASPLYRRLKPHVLGALVENLLHPDAYMARFWR